MPGVRYTSVNFWSVKETGTRQFGEPKSTEKELNLKKMEVHNPTKVLNLTLSTDR